MFGPWDRSSTAPGASYRERPELVELPSPEDEGDLLLLRSVLDAAGIPYFVKGDLFGSLTVGPRIDHYNRKTIFVHPEHAEEAGELVAEFRAKTARPASGEAAELRGRDVLRMVCELLFFGWFLPGRRSRTRPRPRMRLIRGEGADEPPATGPGSGPASHTT